MESITSHHCAESHAWDIPTVCTPGMIEGENSMHSLWDPLDVTGSTAGGDFYSPNSVINVEETEMLMNMFHSAVERSRSDSMGSISNLHTHGFESLGSIGSLGDLGYLDDTEHRNYVGPVKRKRTNSTGVVAEEAPKTPLKLSSKECTERDVLDKKFHAGGKQSNAGECKTGAASPTIETTPTFKPKGALRSGSAPHLTTTDHSKGVEPVLHSRDVPTMDRNDPGAFSHSEPLKDNDSGGNVANEGIHSNVERSNDRAVAVVCNQMAPPSPKTAPSSASRPQSSPGHGALDEKKLVGRAVDKKQGVTIGIQCEIDKSMTIRHMYFEERSELTRRIAELEKVHLQRRRPPERSHISSSRYGKNSSNTIMPSLANNRVRNDHPKPRNSVIERADCRGDTSSSFSSSHSSGSMSKRQRTTKGPSQISPPSSPRPTSHSVVEEQYHYPRQYDSKQDWRFVSNESLFGPGLTEYLEHQKQVYLEHQKQVRLEHQKQVRLEHQKQVYLQHQKQVHLDQLRREKSLPPQAQKVQIPNAHYGKTVQGFFHPLQQARQLQEQHSHVCMEQLGLAMQANRQQQRHQYDQPYNIRSAKPEINDREWINARGSNHCSDYSVGDMTEKLSLGSSGRRVAPGFGHFPSDSQRVELYQELSLPADSYAGSLHPSLRGHNDHRAAGMNDVQAKTCQGLMPLEVTQRATPTTLQALELARRQLAWAKQYRQRPRQAHDSH